MVLQALLARRPSLFVLCHDETEWCPPIQDQSWQSSASLRATFFNIVFREFVVSRTHDTKLGEDSGVSIQPLIRSTRPARSEWQRIEDWIAGALPIQSYV